METKNNKYRNFNVQDSHGVLCKIFTLLLLVNSFMFGLNAQDDLETKDSTSIKIKNKEVIIGNYENQNSGQPVDTNILEIGNKMFIFIEYEDGMIIDRVDLKTGGKKRLLDLNEKDFEDTKDTLKMRGHWSGFEYGLNNFMNRDYTFDLPEDAGYMALNTWRSWNFNFNFSQSTTPIISDRFAIVGGMGIAMHQYNFKRDNNVQVNETTGDIEERVYQGVADIRKSKLNTTYLTIPVLLELQLGKGMSKDRFYFSAGVVGGLKIASRTKMVYGEKGEKKKIVEKGGDLNLNRWKLDATARLGYKDAINVYASYAILTLFEKDKGPELYPFTVGFRINFGD